MENIKLAPKGLNQHEADVYTEVVDQYAIFQTGGKQYQAIPGKTVSIETVPGNAGDMVEFSEVLLKKSSADNILIGQPYVEGVKIKASIVKHMKDPKVVVF